VPEAVFRGTRDRPLPAWAQLAFLFRERRRHDKARVQAGARGQRLRRGVFNAQKAPGPRGAQIQPSRACPTLLGLYAGHGDKAQRAGVGVQRFAWDGMILSKMPVFMAQMIHNYRAICLLNI